MKNLLFLFIIIIYSSCTKLPDESLNQLDLEKKISTESAEKVKLIEFKKENALKKNFLGIEYYEVFYSGKLKYLTNGYVKKPFYSEANFLNVYKENPKQPFCQCNGYKVIKDSEFVINGKMIYMNTENGWQTNNKDITFKIFSNKKDK